MILPGVATVAVVWRLALEMWDREAANVAACMLALSSYHVLACEELRMYPLVGLWLSLAAWGLWRMRAGWGGLPLYVAGATLALYTYYLSGFVLLALTPLALRDYPWRRWVTANVLVTLLFLPWLPTVWLQAHGQNLELRDAPPVAWFPELMFQMDFGLTLPRPLAGWAGAQPLDPLKWIGLVVPALGAWLLWRRRDVSGAAPWLGGGLFVPIVLIAGLSFTHTRVFEYKYFTMVAPYFALLVGWGAQQLGTMGQRAWRNAVGLLLVGLNLLSIGLLWQDPSLGQADWKAADNYLLPQLAPGDTVWVMPNMDMTAVQMYQGNRHLPDGVQFVPTNQLPPSVAAPNGRLWLVDTCFHPLVQQLHPDEWLEAHGLHADPAFVWQSVNFFPSNVIRVQLFAAAARR
jgi:4-amino-4-deoxy-L-arabinose transferase-like glycosyltransferase